MQEETQGKIYVVVADKGGVGKTQTAVNLADWLAHLSRSKVIMPTFSPERPLPITFKRGNTFLGDGDPQGDSTKCIWNTMPENLRWYKGRPFNPMDERLLPNTMTTLLTDPVISFDECLYTNEYGLTVLPANHTLNEVDNSITPGQVRHLFTGWASELRKRFRWSIFDTRRAGSMLTLSIMKEADYVLMVMENEFLAMEDMELTIKSIELIKKLNPALQLLGILPTKLDYSTVSKMVKEELHDFLLTIEQNLEQRIMEDKKKTVLSPEEQLVGKYSKKILPFGIQRSRFQREAPGARLPVRLYIELPELKLSPAKRQKARDDTNGYEQLAEMIMYTVPPELYLPENSEQRIAFLNERKSV